MVEVIDAHVHLWDTDRFHYPWLESAPSLRRRANPGLVTSLWGTKPEGAILVQADCAPEQGLAEAKWLAGQATAWPLAGVVAFAPLEDKAMLAGHLGLLSEIPGIVGVRRLLQGLPPGALSTTALADGLTAVGAAGLAFDACVRADQLPALAGLLRDVPGTAVVMDHLGNPSIDGGLASSEGSAWLSDMERLAALPQVHVKLSGPLLHTIQDPARSSEALPFLAATLQLFGPQRCMVGSDSPVSVPSIPYPGGWAVRLADQLQLDSSALQDVLSQTATRFYRLERGFRAAAILN